MAQSITLLGIVNVTPDSFSDGGQFLEPEAAVSHAQKLVSDGAAIIDLGADSTRKGSVCAGEDEEWRRLAPIVEALASTMTLSIDTHFFSTARRAIHNGAKIINDISGGSQEMFELAADTDTTLITMYSRCPAPHDFSASAPQHLLDTIKLFFDKKIEMAHMIGLPLNQLIFDPGMGNFISDDAADSELLINSIEQLKEYSPLCICVSRKGFLQRITAPNLVASFEAEDMDQRSVRVARFVADALPKTVDLFLRVHDVAGHQFLK